MTISAKLGLNYHIRCSEHRLQRDFRINSESQTVSSQQLQQQELVAFLFHRFRVGIFITLFVSLVTAGLAYVELAIQGREHFVIGWYLLLCLILALRWRLLQQFLALPNKSYFQFQYWHSRFYAGVVVTGLMLGCGAALAMSYISPNVQIVFHATLLTMCAGAIAYLSTSFRVYIAYMVTLITPVTLWLLLQQTSASYVLSCLYIFFMIAGYISVKRMNELVHDALYYRYDNEALIEDLERLLASVSQSNKALEKISITDELTGIANYRAFRVQLEDTWRQYRGQPLPVSLIKFNVDHYHLFNAHYGQEAGDRYLREIASMLSRHVAHKSQIAARLQGAEFALLLPGVSCENARNLALDIRQELEQKKIENVKAAGSPYLTLSIGLGSQAVGPESSSRELLVRADTALKLAQQRGHDRLEILEG